MEADDRSAPSAGERIALVTGLTAAIVVRVVQIAVKWDQGLLLNDSYWYSAQAVVIADGNGFADPFSGDPSAEHAPLTPIVLAVVSWLDGPLPWQRLVMTLVGILGVLAIMLLARRLGGWAAAAVAVWIAALYPNLWINDALVMSESIAVLLTVVVVWFALDVVGDSPEPWRAVACGIAIGLAALTRSELVLMLPLLLLVLWLRREVVGRWMRSAALIVAGTVVALAPWVGPNLVRFEQPVVLTTNDGTTLLGANCPDTYGGAGVGGWSLLCVLDAGDGPDEDPSERSDRQRRLAGRYALDHAERLPVVVAARLGRLLDVTGLSDMVAGDVGEERPRWAVWAGIASFWVLAVLAVVGLVGLDRTRRAVLLVPITSVVLTTVLFYGGHRIRAPAEPVVVVAAALGALCVVRHVRRASPPVSERPSSAGASRVAP